MKIVMFSINPIFPEMVTGGASKHLYHIAHHLGKLGHKAEIVCAKPNGEGEKFTWAENVTVYPVLPFHLPFPQPYAISGGDLALIVDRLTEHLLSADRFYVHDGELLLTDLYMDIPTIISYRDNIYPESVLGSFIGRADEILCVSKYSAAVIAATAGRFYPGLVDRIHQINNGLDTSVFKYIDPTPLAERFGIDLGKDVVLLHPHRPEPGKGLPETIRVANRLVYEYGYKDLKVLVPEWIESMVSGGERHFHDQMLALLDELYVRKHFQFIPWVPQTEMPALYSLGKVTLCLGNIVEAFGNVAYESLACQTPSVVAKVGVHRTLLPDSLLDKVPYGDITLAAEKAADILQEDREVSNATTMFLKDHLGFDKQVQTYAEVILSAKKRPTLQFHRPKSEDETRFTLAPWCYFEGERVYHDYKGQYFLAGMLKNLVSTSETFTKRDAKQEGLTHTDWDDWMEKTLIVPAYRMPEEK